MEDLRESTKRYVLFDFTSLSNSTKLTEDVEKVSPCIYLKTVTLLRQNMVRCTLTQQKEFVHRPVFQTINESRPPRTSSNIMHSGAEKQEGS